MSIALGLTLYFSTHEAEGITPQLFETADMALLEQDYMEDDDRNLNLLNELSLGNLLIDDVLRATSVPGGQLHPDFNSGLLSMIFRSGKQILLEHSPYNFYEVSVLYIRGRQEFRNMPL